MVGFQRAQGQCQGNDEEQEGWISCVDVVIRFVLAAVAAPVYTSVLSSPICSRPPQVGLAAPVAALCLLHVCLTPRLDTWPGLCPAVAHKGVHQHEGIAAAKGAVSGLMIGAASTYASHNIRVNAVAPGLVSVALLCSCNL